MTKKSKKNELTNIKNGDLIVQHNYLIEAQYHLTLQEKRLMCWLASQVKSDDEDFMEHELSIKDFALLTEVSGDHLYKSLEIITHKLMQKIITIRSINGKSFMKAAWIGGVQYIEGRGIIKLSFHPYLKPYMLHLKERFTQIKLADLMGLKSVYAMRVFELLKQYESIGRRKIDLSELKLLCGIQEDQYLNFKDFRRRILTISQREINEKTDIWIDYEELKTSRKVTSIQFSIKPNPNYGKTHFEKAQAEKIALITKELRSKNALVEHLIEYGFSKQAATRILKNNQESDITNAIKAVDIQVQRGKAKNPKAMLSVAIKDKWHPEKYKASKKLQPSLKPLPMFPSSVELS